MIILQGEWRFAGFFDNVWKGMAASGRIFETLFEAGMIGAI